MESPGVISYLTAPDGHLIALRTWQARYSVPRGIVHVCHGMAEHSGRYAGLAARLTASGWLVVAHDHRGHGDPSVNQSNSVAGDGLPGHYADHQGWQRVLDDVGQVQQSLRAVHPGLPIVLMGHSMGALIVQGYLVAAPLFWPSAVVLSGPSRDPRIKVRALLQVVRFESWRRGPRQSSPLLNRLTFGDFSRSVKTARTDFDWLSSDPSEVQAYLDDPLCGFDCTIGLWRDLGRGLLGITARGSFGLWPNDLPVYVFAGARDPVGHFGKGPKALVGALRQAGQTNVRANIYPQMRHETLHETERERVMDDLEQWLDMQVPVAPVKKAG